MALADFDQSEALQRKQAREKLQQTLQHYDRSKAAFLTVFAETRFLHNPPDYLADGNMNRHLAAPGNNPDWMFAVETQFIETINQWLTTIDE